MNAPGRSVKRTIVGRRMPTGSLEDELLPRWIALPIFASDPLSSVAYATEAALVVLMATSVASRGLIVPMSAIIALLLIVVVLSYRQTIFAYPNGGGSYVVAKENLGQLAGLVAAASLLVDYVLTAAVSIASGVLAVTSAVPELSTHAVELSLGVLVLLVLVNLRGVRESGFVFALPTYGFIVSVGVMIVVGLVRGIFWGWPTAHVPDPAQLGLAGGVGLLVLLRAFASGCSALTGVEAISNGVTAFRRPQARNAASTLLWMGVIAVVLFMGVSVLAYKVSAQPSESVSVLSEIARAVFPAGGSSFGYYAVQATTAAVLVLAANTAFQGFPRLAASRPGAASRPSWSTRRSRCSWPPSRVGCARRAPRPTGASARSRRCTPSRSTCSRARRARTCCARACRASPTRSGWTRRPPWTARERFSPATRRPRCWRSSSRACATTPPASASADAW